VEEFILLHSQSAFKDSFKQLFLSPDELDYCATLNVAKPYCQKISISNPVATSSELVVVPESILEFEEFYSRPDCPCDMLFDVRLDDFQSDASSLVLDESRGKGLGDYFKADS